MTTPTDIFRDSVNAMLCNVHTALPGIVVAYDSSTNKATIQPALNKAFTSGEKPMPLLENVPVMFPNKIKFPITKGEYVLLIFMERSIDLWKSVGGQVTPDDPRKFDLSDAVAIPGLTTFADTATGANQDFTIEYAGSSITIKSNGDIIIKTAGTVAIGNSTTELLDEIIKLANSLALNLASGPGPYPGVVTDAEAISLALGLIKGTIP